MGCDNYYLGLPADAEILSLAHEDANLAENILGSVVTGVWNSGNFKDQLRSSIDAEYPEIAVWRYSPKWRSKTAWAMANAIDIDLGSKYPGRSTGERIIFGDELFLGIEHGLYLANLFRITSPCRVKEFVKFCQSQEMNSLDEQYRHAFLELTEYYQLIASLENMSIICMNL